ncbi:hypothetical protein XCCB100_1185 [Xanthomonas campestris pv. campestris]|uniref:Uncharacterized protein n=1 Tax=Xanthomonas campestris pv. campestris (strain B100) TaxID=509169 RepID=B0RPZ8_XANCB|nr:hypothetical protein XCCB100_1185 [Xanthomonas campestris pv. campestris]
MQASWDRLIRAVACAMTTLHQPHNSISYQSDPYEHARAPASKIDSKDHYCFRDFSVICGNQFGRRKAFEIRLSNDSDDLLHRWRARPDRDL